MMLVEEICPRKIGEALKYFSWALVLELSYCKSNLFKCTTRMILK